MGIILREVGEGRVVTQRGLYDMISYKAEVTYGALRVSVRHLVEQEMIVKQTVGREVTLVPTTRGYDWFRPKRI